MFDKHFSISPSDCDFVNVAGSYDSLNQTITAHVRNAGDLLPFSQPIPRLTQALSEPFQGLPRGTGRPNDVPPLPGAQLYQSCGDAYTNLMQYHGHGLPCFDPRLGGRTVRIGDVGVLDADGFLPVFNLYCPPHDWDLTAPHTKTDPLSVNLAPGGSPPSTLCSLKIQAGSTLLAPGVVSQDPTRYGRSLPRAFRFKSHQPQGAALVCTSNAYLETLPSLTALHTFISANAGTIYQYVVGQRHSGESLERGQSLYIITGHITTASWALAAHCEPMPADDHKLTLKTHRRLFAKLPLVPSYQWTRYGTAEMREGRVATVDADADEDELADTKHYLFLRGFLLTPSTSLADVDQDVAPEGVIGRGSNAAHPALAGDIGGGPEDTSTGQEECCQSIVEATRPTSTQHKPLQTLNECLLEMCSEADFVLSHDDHCGHILNLHRTVAEPTFFAPDTFPEPWISHDSTAADALATVTTESSRVYPQLLFLHHLSPLMVASRGGDEDAVKRLLNLPGTDVNQTGPRNTTALLLAAQHGHGGITGRLLSHPNISISHQDADGFTALTFLLKNTNSAALLVTLCLARIPLDGLLINAATRPMGRTALMFAAESGRESALEDLLERADISVNQQDAEGSTALALASKNGHSGAVGLLLEAPDVLVNLKDASGATALMLAAENGHGTVVRLLLYEAGGFGGRTGRTGACGAQGTWWCRPSSIS